VTGATATVFADAIGTPGTATTACPGATATGATDAGKAAMAGIGRAERRPLSSAIWLFTRSIERRSATSGFAMPVVSISVPMCCAAQPAMSIKLASVPVRRRRWVRIEGLRLSLGRRCGGLVRMTHAGEGSSLGGSP
jgi:hypothetical protein